MPQIYWTVLFGGVVFTYAVGLATGLLRRRKHMKTVVEGASGWMTLLPERSRQSRFYGALLLLCLLGAPLIALALNVVAHHAWGRGGTVFVVVVLGIALATVLNLAGAFASWKTIGDARVSLKPVPVRRDQEVEFRIEIPVLRSTATEILARVVCIEHAVVHMGRFTHAERRIVREREMRIAAVPVSKTWLGGTGAVTLPADTCPPTGPGKSLNFNYAWQLRVELPGKKTHFSVFPLQVL